MLKGNIYQNLKSNTESEVFEELLAKNNVLFERIISLGQATPKGQWLSQENEEWVLLIQGSAGLMFEEDGKIIILSPGDWVHIPSNTKHRVEFTDKYATTLWLAVHF